MNVNTVEISGAKGIQLLSQPIDKLYESQQKKPDLVMGDNAVERVTVWGDATDINGKINGNSVIEYLVPV